MKFQIRKEMALGREAVKNFMKTVYEESEMGLGPLRNIKLASFVFEDLRSMMFYTNNMVDDTTIFEWHPTSGTF